MSTRTYQDAVEHLNSLQSNAATLEAVRASGGRSSAFAIPEMLEYLEIIGYTPQELNALNVIHITGTKGKGSTSAFTESAIRHAKPAWKTGLYTSPHLVAVRERIRINGAPLSESKFAEFFFQVWDKLSAKKVKKVPTTPDMPGYFRFLTLMAYHVFLASKVDVTVLEVGVGGTYDSTNIVPKPITTGITALGIDHVNVLGKTLPEIAWQKGGIFKEDVPAFTVEQPSDAMDVLESRAKELKAKNFNVVPISSVVTELEAVGLKLGLAGVHQRQNASLAVTLVNSFLQTQIGIQDAKDYSEAIKKGLVETKWPGRCQTVVDPKRPGFTWYLDGAHTLESLDCCIQWFVSPGVGISASAETATTRPFARFLIFNCTSGRSGQSFLSKVKDIIATQLWVHNRDAEGVSTFFDHVLFCTNVTYADGNFKGDLTTKALSDSELTELKTQYTLASAWTSLFPAFPSENIHVLPSIEHALQVVEQTQSATGASAKVLVAGSLHLVGGVVEAAGLSDVAL